MNQILGVLVDWNISSPFTNNSNTIFFMLNYEVFFESLLDGVDDLAWAEITNGTNFPKFQTDNDFLNSTTLLDNICNLLDFTHTTLQSVTTSINDYSAPFYLHVLMRNYTFTNLGNSLTPFILSIIYGRSNLIKRIQNYSAKIINSSQPLCSFKETAFTKISGFRKYTL